MMRAVEEVQFVAEVAVAAVGREVDEKNGCRKCEYEEPVAMSFGSDGAIVMRLRSTSTPPAIDA